MKGFVPSIPALRVERQREGRAQKPGAEGGRKMDSLQGCLLGAEATMEM